MRVHQVLYWGTCLKNLTAAFDGEQDASGGVKNFKETF